jgi:hypothetical protein
MAREGGHDHLGDWLDVWIEMQQAGTQKSAESGERSPDELRKQFLKCLDQAVAELTLAHELFDEDTSVAGSQKATMAIRRLNRIHEMLMRFLRHEGYRCGSQPFLKEANSGLGA